MSNFSVQAPAWNDISAAEVVAAPKVVADNCLVVPTSCGELSVTISDHGVRLRAGKRIEFDYGMLKCMPENYPLSVSQKANVTIASANNLSVVVHHSPFSFEVVQQRESEQRVVQQSATDGHFVRRYRMPPLAKVDDGWFMSFELGADEPVYGLGEKWSKLDKRGQLVRSFNHDALGVNAEISYKNTPFCWSPNGWGLFIHTPAPVTHGVGYAPWSQRGYGVLIEDSALDVFILTQESGADIINSYTKLTGKAPMPPEWSLGVILSKAYYKDVEELLSTAKAVRENNMPCDVITLDGRAWQDTETRFAFEWDSKRYHDPAAVIAELKAMQFKVCVWEYPLISVKNPLFHELAEKGWLIKDKRTGQAFEYEWDMSAFGEVLTPLPKSGILDFTHPEAYAFWRDSHKPLFEMGVDMIKADFGEQIEDENMQASNGEKGSALHNVYTLLYNRCVYEAAKRYCKTGPFLFSRSAWIGSQCYPSQWGGDPQADWGGLAGSIRGGVSWGLSGAPFYATDVGGFYKDTRDAELFARWNQVAVFSAHMRLHGIGPREPWSYGEEAEAAANKALKLRYQLMPYIHQTMEQATLTGLPMQRAMVLAFPDQPQLWAFEMQFMFGEDMLVAPCIEPGGHVSVYLPEGEWQRFEPEKASGQIYHGNQYLTLSLALDEFAVFIRAGVKIPMAAPVEHTEALAEQGKTVQSIDHFWPQD
ncbi:alpha-xylosidase [Thalassotalea euphylliae]|uniref:glycoside hydrolase family 31 protein n=1 Tax=Thalassotalea euphylliae TaxID=1655234 RepID=UPI00363E3D7D